MHEMSLAEGVLQAIEQSAATHGFSRVKTVWLEIGTLSAVEPEAMRFCFDAVVRGTLAEGAKLEILLVEGRGCCATCGKTVPVRNRYDPCPLCDGYAVVPTDGMQMRVKELEVD